MKFGNYTNMNMQNLMVVSIFSILDREYLFGGKFGPKNENCQFEQKFGTLTNSNMQHLMVILTFSVSTKNTFFKQIWFKKKKFSLS